MLTTIIGILMLFVGVGMGYWFASFTKIYDLKQQNAQFKAKVDRLQDLVDYYENKPTK